MLGFCVEKQGIVQVSGDFVSIVTFAIILVIIIIDVTVVIIIVSSSRSSRGCSIRRSVVVEGILIYAQCTGGNEGRNLLRARICMSQMAV